jgi:ethanolamine utilization microcompartment shell protein EutL
MIASAIWAPVVLALMAWIAFMVWQVTSVFKSRQVSVWCYADPNSDRGTSNFTGDRDAVKGICPDARSYYAPTNP